MIIIECNNGLWHVASEAWLFTSASGIIKEKKTKRKAVRHTVAMTVIAFDNYRLGSLYGTALVYKVLRGQRHLSSGSD
uniref:Uncharacterized protein n=1 Tax=Anguilla anguilla TaxID=7936 RepID=A0A0E9QPZ6_ANGAN